MKTAANKKKMMMKIYCSINILEISIAMIYKPIEIFKRIFPLLSFIPFLKINKLKPDKCLTSIILDTQTFTNDIRIIKQ